MRGDASRRTRGGGCRSIPLDERELVQGGYEHLPISGVFAGRPAGNIEFQPAFTALTEVPGT